MNEIEKHRCFEGTLAVYEHASAVLQCDMKFSIFLPSNSDNKLTPFVTFLSGLTCTHENFTTKAGAYAAAARAGLGLIVPDTSPRGEHVPDQADAYDLGKGASFYLDATKQPWADNYRMETYIADELNSLVCKNFPLDPEKQGICGHSMGGHGALTLYLKYPHLFKSASAFSPIVAPSQVPWGRKAFTHYLGDDNAAWLEHDACALMRAANNRREFPSILIDQGGNDEFLVEQLKPHLFEEACAASGQSLRLRLHEGYDHSYYFIQSFISDHVNHHVAILSTSQTT